ncbi:hypothetical protein AB6A40_008992 [Gnathostoma spinigerum]|uniref:Uncharacterized protein n=1 Tax=Gnathostoma spinigerum TaxID=75299 RepID=A0ABD6EQQ3_9BILA
MVLQLEGGKTLIIPAMNTANMASKCSGPIENRQYLILLDQMITLWKVFLEDGVAPVRYCDLRSLHGTTTQSGTEHS